MTFDVGGRVVTRVEKPEQRGLKLEVTEVGLIEKVVASGAGYLLSDVLSPTALT